MKLKNWTINILSAIEYYKGNLVSSNGTIATDESQNGKKKTFKISYQTLSAEHTQTKEDQQ